MWVTHVQIAQIILIASNIVATYKKLCDNKFVFAAYLCVHIVSER